MITHVRIQNLRSLVDTGFIEIKPLTILLGSNSSGKSTFLRSFPLLTQSVTKSLREPISWFDESYVDFGDYDTAKSKFVDNNDGIIFSYKISKPLSKRTSLYVSINDEVNPYIIIPGSTINISFVKDNKGMFVNKVTLMNGNLNVELFIADRDSSVIMTVNGARVMEELNLRWSYGSRRKLIPEFENDNIYDEMPNLMDSKFDNYANSVLRKYCSKNLKNNVRLWEIISNWTSNKQCFLKILQKTKLTMLSKYANAWDVETKEFNEIYDTLALFYTIKSLDAIDDEIRTMYYNCSYITPMRAPANRYYRTQGFQVRDVDSNGKNLQEFISSLSGKREKSYRNFTEKVLGLQIMVKNNAGHQQIILKSKYGENNMADVGFGYSQIIPIITKLWYSNYQLKNEVQGRFYWRNFFSNIMLIEQPELHLHPEMQARAIDIMMLVLKDNKENNENLKRIYRERERKEENIIPQCFASLIIETHSQSIINRIGRRIRNKQFSPDDVSILLFDKRKETGITEIKEIKFNEKGQLMNWPIGFFEPKEEEYDILFNK